MDELIGLLNDERLKMEELLYRLVSIRGLLLAGEARFINRASVDVEEAINAVYAVEARRTRVISDLACQIGWPPSRLTLRTLVEISEEPYRTTLRRLRTEFLRLTEEIEKATAVNRNLAKLGAGRLANLLALLHPSAGAEDWPMTYRPEVQSRAGFEERALGRGGPLS